jgi:integrase
LRIERAIDAYLDWRRLERDATPRSIDSYWRVLSKLATEYPEAEIGTLSTADLRAFLGEWVRESKAERGIDLSAATRSNIISVLHSFFGWAEVEDLVDVDVSRKIQRPRKRKPDVYRPSLTELSRVRAAAIGHERPPVLLLEGVGLRRAEVLGCRWQDLDFERGRIRVKRKGQHWHWVPIDRDVLHELRSSYRDLRAESEHHLFTVEVEQWVSATTRERRLKDPSRPGSEQALWRLVKRVCKRAGVRALSPHQLRHGFEPLRVSCRLFGLSLGLLG